MYERKDDSTNENFYRLVGGCIEFNESSSEALVREFKEELSSKIINIKLLTIFESIFTFNNQSMHEIVFLFESDFMNRKLYDKESLQGIEGDRTFNAIWMPVRKFKNNEEKLYPEDVINFI